MLTHRCHAYGCTMPVAPRLLMCRTHWSALRPALKDAIWREYRTGQEKTKRPTARYAAVQRLAIAELAFRPGDEQAAAISASFIIEAQRWRELAIETGQGDPLEGLMRTPEPDSPPIV